MAESSKDKIKETVCTVTVLNHALQNGIEIHQFDKENKEGLEETLARLSLSDSERSRIKQDIKAGNLITIPDEDVTIGSWTGTGYISLDKATGAGAYMISGSLNGGEHPVVAYSVAVLAVYMEYLSSKILVNALMSVLVPGVIKLLGAALIVTGLYVLHMMMVAYADYMFEGGEDRFDKFIEWAMASSFMSSLQMQFAWLVMSMFGLNAAYEDGKDEPDPESESTPETTPEANPENTPETDPENIPESDSGTGQVGGGEGKAGESSIVPNKGFDSFNDLKKELGSPGEGNAWHHIVEQSQINNSGFSSTQVNNINNIISIPHGKGSVHAIISGYYSSKQFFTGGQTVRQWLAGQSFQEQFDFGMNLLKQYGTVIPTSNGWVFIPF